LDGIEIRDMGWERGMRRLEKRSESSTTENGEKVRH